MRNPVRVQKRKYDGTVRREFGGDLAEATPDGWLAVFHDAGRHESYKDGRRVPPNDPDATAGGTWSSSYIIYVLSDRQPLAVAFAYDELGELEAIHADAALPAVVRGRELSFVDLDLDLVVARDMTYEARDFETFEQNSLAMGYPAGVRESALAGLALAEQLVTEQAYPFGGAMERLLGRVLASEGPL